MQLHVVVISVEPNPDNSPELFALKPLAHMVATDAPIHTPINMEVGLVKLLMGSVTR